MYEKSHNIINHQRNTNQNYSEILFHTHQEDYNQKHTMIVGVPVGKLEPSYTADDVEWCSCFGRQSGSSSG